MSSPSRKQNHVDLAPLLDTGSEGRSLIRPPNHYLERRTESPQYDPDLEAHASMVGTVVYHMSDYRNDPCPFDGLELPELEPPRDLKEHIFRAVAEELVKDAANLEPQPPALRLVPTPRGTETDFLMNSIRRRLAQWMLQVSNVFVRSSMRMFLACAGLILVMFVTGKYVSNGTSAPLWSSNNLSYTSGFNLIVNRFTGPNLIYETQFIKFTRLGTWNPGRTRHLELNKDLSWSQRAPGMMENSFLTALRRVTRAQGSFVFVMGPAPTEVKSTSGPVALLSTDGGLMITSYSNQACLWQLEPGAKTTYENAQVGVGPAQSSSFEALVSTNARMMLTIDGQGLRSWRLTSSEILRQKDPQGMGALLSAPAEPCNLLTPGTSPTG